MHKVLTKLSLGHVLRSARKAQEDQRNQMLNLLCTMAMCAFKELVYSGLMILNSKDSIKDFDKIKKYFEYFLKVQSQIVITMYEGLSHLNRNGFYIPFLQKLFCKGH